MEFKGYTKRDTAILKGFGILCIVFHNYFHWLWPSPGENEFTFDPARVSKFFAQLGAQPGEFFNLIFSYLGHYGVQIFVLLSGFGLAVSMMNKPQSWGRFVWKRFLKLYPLLLTALVFYYFGRILMEAKLLGPYEKHELGYKLLLVHTLVPDSALSLVGPWWFFGLIFQLYLLFPLVFRWTRRGGWKAFLSVCVVCYGLIFLFRYGLNVFKGSVIMMNAPGHLPEFCLGVLLAFSKDKKISLGWLLLSVSVFCLGNYFAVFYPFTFLALSVMMVFAYQGVKNLRFRKRWLSRPLAYVGNLSMAIFAVHACFRGPVLKVAASLKGPWGHFLSGMMFLVIILAISVAAYHFYTYLCHLIAKVEGAFERKWGSKKSPVVCQGLRWVERLAGVSVLAFFVFILGYFIAQNVEKPQTSFTQEMKQNTIIPKDKEYVYLVNDTIGSRSLNLSVTGSFDIQGQVAQGAAPRLVMTIGDLLWKPFELPQDFFTNTPKHFEFSYYYHTPFVVNLKGKPVKVFFWNPNKQTAEFENTSVTIKY